VGEIIVLALLASLNPTLLAAATVMMLLDRPKGLMAGWLLGAYTTSITLGLIIVFELPHSGATKTARKALSPGYDFALGAIALAVAYAIHTWPDSRVKQRRETRKATKPDKQPPRWQRELSKGSPRITFVLGVLTTLPGASYLAGLDHLHNQHYSTIVTVLGVIGFVLVMLWLLEVPLVCYTVAPEWTPQAIDQAKAWFARHARVYAIRGFAAIGALLVIKGIVELFH
jgi:Sap, sulfolipid-1-addressing protein